VVESPSESLAITEAGVRSLGEIAAGIDEAVAGVSIFAVVVGSRNVRPREPKRCVAHYGSVDQHLHLLDRCAILRIGRPAHDGHHIRLRDRRVAILLISHHIERTKGWLIGYRDRLGPSVVDRPSESVAMALTVCVPPLI